MYVGTTDTVYDEAVINPKALESDHNYVIKAINYMFPDVHITEKILNQVGLGFVHLSMKKEKIHLKFHVKMKFGFLKVA